MKAKRLQQQRRPPSIGRRILLFVLIVVCVFSISSTASAAGTGNENRMTLSASNYMYDDVMYNQSTRWSYTRDIDTWEQHLITLYNYRHSIISQYNNDIVDLVDYFNKLSATDQQAYLSEFNKVLSNLTNYDRTSPLYDGSGAFIRAFRFLYLDRINGYAQNEYDADRYTEYIRTAFESFTALKNTLYERSVAVGDVQSDEIIGETLSMLEMMWLSLGVWLSGAAGATTGTSSVVTSVFSMFNAETIVNTYLPMFQTAAYLVFFIAFATGIMDSAVRFDISDPKVIIKLLCRVIIAKVLIDLSSLICFFIFNYINGFASAIIGQANQLMLISPAATSDNYSSIPVIGWLVSFLQSLADLIPVLIVSVITFFCVLRAMVKLLTRSFEMISLTCLSSVFFACFAGETTKKYGERFLISFISVAGSLIFMAIGYAVGGDIIIQMSQGTSNVGLIYQLVVVWAICKFITNPPKVLSQLVAA